MNSETKRCQNCKADFEITKDDMGFYESIKVPPPTFCPECRYHRRAIWRNARHLFRGENAITGKEIFTGIPPQSGLKIYEYSYWYSDKWDAMDYGINYDFQKPFFEQIKKLFYSVPISARDMQRCVNSDYCDMCDDMKNSYLCFNATFLEDCFYCIGATKSKNCYDMTYSYENELCYETVRVDKSYNIVSSVMLENCFDMFFSKNCVGCDNCFGCVNLRNSSYMIFNQQYSKEDYQNKIKEFKINTWSGFDLARKKFEEFWKKFPIKYMLGFRNYNVIGEDIKDCKNVKYSYIVKKGENLKYVQDLPFTNSSNSYDHLGWGLNSSQIYEAVTCGENIYNLRFCFLSYPSCQDLEYCINVRRSKNLFGCVGLKDKQYCIFNKQYTKEEYFSLREKIINQMNDLPYIDKRGNIYKYGEFFPCDMSPFAYNESLLNDQFPSDKEEVNNMGFPWREINRRVYETTIKAKDIPDSINEVDKNIINEIIGCLNCQKAYKIMDSEFDFLKNLNLPLPRFCVDCRFLRRQKMVAPPKFKKVKCMCLGEHSSGLLYKNIQNHELHGQEECNTYFETAYDPNENIIYCEDCYKKEVY